MRLIEGDFFLKIRSPAAETARGRFRYRQLPE